MPWIPDDVPKFSKDLSPEETKKWVRTANGFLAACKAKKAEPLKSAKGDTRLAKCEASAIILANAKVKQSKAKEAGLTKITYTINDLTESILEVDKIKKIVVLKGIQGDNTDTKKPEDKNYHTGWSKNGMYYSKENIQDLIPLIESARKIYFDHQNYKDGYSVYGRSLYNWAATIVETPWIEDAALYFKADIFSRGEKDDTGWILDAMERHPEQIGMSINAMAYTAEIEKHGIEGQQPKQWIRLHSIDFVTEASAKGSFMDFSEAIEDPWFIEEALQEVEHILQSCGYIESDENPENIVIESNSNNKGRSYKNMAITLEEIRDLGVEQLIASGNKAISEAVKSKSTEVREELNIKIKDLETKIEEKTSEIENLKTEKTGSETKLAEVEKQLAEFKTKIDEYLIKEQAENKANFIKTKCEELKIEKEYVSEDYNKTLTQMEDTEIEDSLKNLAESIEKASKLSKENPPRGDESPADNNDGKTKDNKELTDDMIVNAVKSMRK